MKGGIRIRLPLEAVIVLETLYREGMTTNKRTDLVQKAVETTGLDRVKVKNWIQNRRGKARRRDPNYVIQKNAATASFSASNSVVNPLSMGANPRLYKRPRSASMGSLNLHRPHPQHSTPFKIKNMEKQHDRKDTAEKAWADVSQGLAVLSQCGYHFVCSVYSPEDNVMAVRNSGYGTTFLSTLQGDKGVENLWKAVEVLEESKRRTAKLIDDVRETSNNLPGASKRSMSESESDREDYDSEDYEDDSDDADEENKEMNPSAFSSGYDQRKPQGIPSTRSAPASAVPTRKLDAPDIKRSSSASSTSAAMTLAALADAVFTASSVIERRDVKSNEPDAELAPIIRPKNPTENSAAETGPDRFRRTSHEASNSGKLPSPSDIVSVAYITGKSASQPPDQSTGYRTPTALPHPSPSWNMGNVLLNKQVAKHSFDISNPGQTGPRSAHPYAPGTERNRMTEDNFLPLPNIQSYNTTVANDASSKHGRFGGMAP